MKPLSENLATLSQRAKRAEDNFAAAKSDARDKLEARRAQLKTDVAQSFDRIDSNLQRAGNQTSSDWTAFKAKVDNDRQRLRARYEEAKHSIQARQSENRAEDSQFEAEIAIDYAIAAVEQAELAVLDALAARDQAEAIKLQPSPATA